MPDQETAQVPDELLKSTDGDHENVESLADQPELEMSEEHVDSESALTRVCSACSVQSQTQGEYCPNCGKGFLKANAWKNRRVRVAAIVIAAVVLLGGAGAAIATTVAHNNEVVAAEASAKAARIEKDKVAARLAATAKAQEEADDAERAIRLSMVGEVEGSITTDAQKRVSEETLEGPILRSSCTPLGGGSTDDLTALTTTFSCIAISKENADGTASGYRFSATVNWNDGSYTWHLGD
ncbi:hypothetical protein [Cryobacterium luteum]|uniref:Uncharacterized protein n=1 Tax=Cryobacterium luteum TaxID=1424661 RepID=A0A1H8FG41_9MICO|nr:hypothetical protein [Cryobacterium luteum]TFB93343.1 hypothetical protein E3O10_03465 [Cryobacterium luteum]SEN30048.1 hypothetical protein SAMN05216281_1069 [Cryobacterium luteum]